MTRYVRLELRDGRLEDGARYISREALHARRAPQVRVREAAWYGIGLWLTDVKGVRVLNHGGSMFGYRSDFFFIPEAGVGGVVLTNADSGWPVVEAVKRRTLELVYGGAPEAEEDLRSEVAQTLTALKSAQSNWVAPPDPAAVARLAGRYHNDALGDFTVDRQSDQVVLRFGGWASPVATRDNPDGTTTFVTTEPGIRGLELTAPERSGPMRRLVIRDAQHEYVYEAAP
ncbi:MAG: serine hydrolase, partial [Myxococcota bacterium]|nr:serine hydrolase [Myxococcota bacterium]